MPAKKINHDHIAAPQDIELPRTIHEDLHRLETVDVPIVTISATYRRDIAEHLGEKARILEEAVFSRAHFSMAVGILEQARREGLTSWLVDPTNYVAEADWKKILTTEKIAETIARSPFLKKLKDVVDTFARGRLPIAKAVKDPLAYVTFSVAKPIISMHYESGNLLAAMGKSVLQVVTDPHVRVNYLFQAERGNITFAVFDEDTRKEFLTKAHKMGKDVKPDRVLVTGPPIDPRIVEARKTKRPSLAEKELRLVVATGGLGTNKQEIKRVVSGLGEKIKGGRVKVILYAGTHPDFRDLYEEEAGRFGLEVGDISDENSAVRIIHDTSIIGANQKLIEYAFPWAHGFVTKPSGDMAYDAAAAGCFILSLHPWGEWEENIEKLFTKLGISHKADARNFSKQLDQLLFSGWINDAAGRAIALDKLFLEGAQKIVDLQRKLALQ